MRKPSNHKTAYAERMRRNLHLTPAARRGHARLGEKTVSGRSASSDDKIVAAINRIKGGDGLTAVAKQHRISPERLRRALAEKGEYVRQGRRYRFIPRVRNDLPLYSEGESIRVLVDDDDASSLGEFMAGVRKFLRTNKIEHLAPFGGGGVTDINGRFHLFETDPEELYRLDAKGRAVFHQIYQLSN